MKGVWRLLNSRKFAVYLLLAMLLALASSSFFPSGLTVSDENMLRLERERPVVFWLSERLNTQAVVKNPVFIALSGFLFLSTFSCTLTRVYRRLKAKRAEFDKEQAFSFSVDGEYPYPPEGFKERVKGVLKKKRWEHRVWEKEDGLTVEAEKGIDAGSWGSVVFHAGLLLCFLAAPVTALTMLRGNFLLTEGMTVPLREVFEGGTGKAEGLPDVNVTASGLKGVYAEGKFRTDFSGVLRIEEGGFGREFPFSVNNPVDFGGYQVSLHEFGFSTEVYIKKRDEKIFDYFLNLRNPRSGDYFSVPSEGLSVFALFFPDFYREGGKIGTKTQEPRNPVLLVKLLRGEKEISKGLIKPGEEIDAGEYKIGFTELKNWGGFIIVREAGTPVVILGLVLGIPGLFIRFLSNERKLEIEIRPSPSGTRVLFRGYSRYYPAFLEKEVREMARGLAAEV